MHELSYMYYESETVADEGTLPRLSIRIYAYCLCTYLWAVELLVHSSALVKLELAASNYLLQLRWLFCMFTLSTWFESVKAIPYSHGI